MPKLHISKNEFPFCNHFESKFIFYGIGIKKTVNHLCFLLIIVLLASKQGLLYLFYTNS